MRWYQKRRARINGGLLLVLGVGFAVFTAVRTAVDPQSAGAPTQTEIVLLILVATVLQVGGGATFGRAGNVDPEKARASVRRLVTIGFDLQAMIISIEHGLETDTAGELRRSGITVDHGLRSAARHLEDSIKDWEDVHEEALAEVLEERTNSGPTTANGKSENSDG